MRRGIWIVLLTAVIASMIVIFSIALIDIEDSDLGGDTLLIPNLEQNISNLQEIVVIFPGGSEVTDTDTGSGLGVTELNFWKDGQRWKLRENNDYYADVRQLSALINELAVLALKEPKTRISDKHERLGLGAPEEGGSAIRINLYGDAQSVIAEILLGEVATTRSGQYVRKSGEDQTWLAGPPLENRLSDKPNNWLERPLFPVLAENIRAVTFRDRRNNEHLLSREENVTPFSMVAPDGMKVANPNTLGNLAKLMESIDYSEVLTNPEPGNDSFLDVEHTAVIETFEGIAINTRIGYAKLSAQPLLQLSFAVVGGTEIEESAYSKVDEYNAGYGAWLYEINDQTMEAFAFDAEQIFTEADEDESNKANKKAK